MGETETSSSFNEDDEMDALSVLQMDAWERRRDHEATAKAFGALETLTEVFGQVSEGKCRIIDSPVLLENIRRLAHIMEDYYAANPPE